MAIHSVAAPCVHAYMFSPGGVSSNYCVAVHELKNGLVVGTVSHGNSFDCAHHVPDCFCNLRFGWALSLHDCSQGANASENRALRIGFAFGLGRGASPLVVLGGHCFELEMYAGASFDPVGTPVQLRRSQNQSTQLAGSHRRFCDSCAIWYWQPDIRCFGTECVFFRQTGRGQYPLLFFF